MRLSFGFVQAALVVTAGCSGSGSSAEPQRRAGPVERAAIDAAAPSLRDPCPPVYTIYPVADGLRVERFVPRIAPPVKVGDRCLWIVRIDPRRYPPRLLMARERQQWRPGPAWVEELGLTALINASMYHEDGRSTGLMVDGARVNNERDNPAFGAYFAFGPRRSGLPPVRLIGRGCAGADPVRLRAEYQVVIQNYRLLDCNGKAVPWKDRKIYSAAAVGMDGDGNVVLMHMRSPYRMTQLARIIGRPSLRIRSAMYVEGGPEATLVLAHASAAFARIGSYETSFHENDDNHRAWAIPNVIGFAPRPAHPR